MTTSSLILPAGLKRKVDWARNQGAVADSEIARLSMNCLDLTSLTGKETAEDIRRLCNDAIKYGLASVCIYPEWVSEASRLLKGTEVVTATVINFPFGDKRTNSDEPATPETVAEDISKAVASGAKQVDIVVPHIRRGEYVASMLKAARESCPPDVTLKTILETAVYDNAADLRKACFLAISERFDCLKTSTGKHTAGGATLEAVAVMLQAIQDSGENVGIKITGGLKETKDCAPYIALKHLFSGQGSIRPETFRFGGSSLLNGLLETIEDNQLDPDSKISGPPVLKIA